VISDQDLLILGKKLHTCFTNARTRVSQYGVGWEDGDILDLEYPYCHMALMSGDYDGVGGLDNNGNGPVIINNQVQYNHECDSPVLNKHEREKFYSFLFNDSVFAECYVTRDPSKCDNDGITVRTSLPANLVVAACIATRQAWEFPDIGRSTIRMIKMGLDPRKAHLAAHAIRVSEDGTYYKSHRGGHVALYHDDMDTGAVRNYLVGTLDKYINMNMVDYREARNYGGIPYMWGNGDEVGLIIRDVKVMPKVNSDPFKYIKDAGEIEKRVDVVEEVELAYERILKQ